MKLLARGRARAWARSSVAACVVSVVVTAVVPAPAAAQTDRVDARWADATWVDDLGFATINAVAGGLSAGLMSLLDEDVSFAEAFLEGSTGGAVVYGGKRIGAERFPGAGALGRAVASLGASMVHEAGAPGVLRRLVIPYGPLRLYVDRDAGTLRVKPDLATLYWTAYGLGHGGLDFDVGRSLSVGAPVFVGDGARLDDADGLMVGGAIFMNAGDEARMDDVLAHEVTHVIQRDQVHLSLTRRLERWMAGRVGAGWVLDHVDVGLTTDAPLILGARGLERRANPFEVEAEFLQARTASEGGHVREVSYQQGGDER